VKNGPKFATAEAKWDKNSEGYKAPERFPEDIPGSVVQRIQHTAVEACKTLRVLDYGRVDIRMRPRADDPDDWEFFIIEVNPNPYLEQKSELALAARQSGLSFPDLLERILESALRRTR
jgi:D-alanine-D-alanine ligase